MANAYNSTSKSKITELFFLPQADTLSVYVNALTLFYFHSLSIKCVANLMEVEDLQ